MKKWCLSLTILLAFSGCNPKVVSYLNDSARFKSFETYRIVTTKAESKNLSPENTLIFDLIKQNIHKEMEERAYVKSNVSPDLTLRYEVTSNTRTETNTSVDPFFPVYRIDSRTIYESVILVELLDQKRKLVWQGSYDLRQERKEKKASKAIEKAIGNIFTSYPYKALSDTPDETLQKFKK